MGAFRIVPVLDDLALVCLLQLGVRIHVAAGIAAIVADLSECRIAFDFVSVNA